MHELSIALGIVDSVLEESRKLGTPRIEAVHLRLGVLSGVVRESLLFSWDIACEGTPLAGTKLRIEDIPVTVWCYTCDAEQAPAGWLDHRCGHCGGDLTEIRNGRELLLSALEVQDE